MSSPELVFALAKGQNSFFEDLAKALLFEVGKLGGSGRIEVGTYPEQRPGSVTVLLPPHEYVKMTGVDPTAAMIARTVLISAEQPNSEFFEWNAALARHAGAVLDINRRAVRAYHKEGIAAAHLQLGYSDAWNKRAEVPERDIDLLFIGRTTPRRERALAGYANVLERFNCRLLLSDNSRPNVGGGVNFESGDEKLRLLSRSKVLLNVHGDEEPYFEWLRIAEAMSCGCAVVTEHSTDIAPLRPGEDLIAGRSEALGLLAAWLVEDDQARADLVARADAGLRERATLAAGAAALLEAAERVDRTLVPTRAETDIEVANARMTISPPSTEATPTPTDDGFTSAERQILRALKRQHREMLIFRRRFAAETLARARPDRPRPETIDVDSTTAWSERPPPSVSVIVPLYNDADVVIEALDSVRRSTFSSWEVVVVDDASTDGGADTVRAWMDRNDAKPATLVRHEVNRGLAAARNTGASKSRGELLLMLDSDNKLRRLGLARLAGALNDELRAAFAYGMLDRFNTEEPVGIVSQFGWEPARLREGNYIDALALIRRSAFSKLGGYSEDARLLLGYEDYDFWARLAEAGEHGVFVRQFVASYRVGHSSMLSMTNLSKVDAVAAVAEHAPQLMTGVDLQV